MIEKQALVDVTDIVEIFLRVLRVSRRFRLLMAQGAMVEHMKCGVPQFLKGPNKSTRPAIVSGDTRRSAKKEVEYGC